MSTADPGFSRSVYQPNSGAYEFSGINQSSVNINLSSVPQLGRKSLLHQPSAWISPLFTYSSIENWSKKVFHVNSSNHQLYAVNFFSYLFMQKSASPEIFPIYASTYQFVWKPLVQTISSVKTSRSSVLKLSLITFSYEKVTNH